MKSVYHTLSPARADDPESGICLWDTAIVIEKRLRINSARQEDWTVSVSNHNPTLQSSYSCSERPQSPELAE